MPGLASRTVTGAGAPGCSESVCGRDGRAVRRAQPQLRRTPPAWSSTLTGSSAPDTAVGGSAVTPGDAVGARSTPAPARSGGRSAGSAAAISAARSWAGLSSGRVRASRAAAAAARAAAIALPPATAALPPGPTVSALPAAARSGFGSPPALGPWEANGEISGAASVLGPRSVSPKLTSLPGLSFSTASATSPVTPITGAAARPAASAGSGRSRGSASRTALAPTAAAAAACAAGLAPARTITTLPRIAGLDLAELRPGRCPRPGPAVVPPAGGSPASTAPSPMPSM